MSIRPFPLLLFALALLAPPLPASAKKAEPLQAHVRVAVSVDATGRVESLRFADEALPAAIRDPLAREMRGWEFEPAMVEGRPAASLTHVSLTLLAEPTDAAGDAYAVRIEHVSNGPARLEAPPPRYPHSAVRQNLSARLVVAFEVAPDGSVRDVGLRSLEALGGKERRAQVFVEPSLETIRSWRFEPEQVDGRAIATRMAVPLTYCIGTTQCFEDGERVDIPDRAPSGEAIAEQPATRLKTDVIGRTL